MANKYYKLIQTPSVEIDGKNYFAETFNLSLKELLEKYFDKDIYIYNSSLETKEITAIII